MNVWTNLHCLVDRIAGAACRHPSGVVCEHRCYGYDRWYRGYGDGFSAGKSNMEAKWLGNVTGTGPYADYPPPFLLPAP